MGVDFLSKTFLLSDGSVVNCLVYDTCGQERYHSINESYYRKADAVLLVYDISQKKTFEKIKDYYCEQMKNYCKKNIPVILLGNKTDLENERQVSQEEGIQLALKEKFKFKETSCIKNENVASAFEALIELWNIENRKKDIINRNRRSSLDYVDNTKDNTPAKNNTIMFNADNLLKGINDSSIKLKKGKKKKKNHKTCCD